MSSQLSLFSDIVSSNVKFPSTRYQGSKHKFVDWIWDCIKDIPFNTVLDAFGGTGCISFKLKEKGKEVTYNDILPFNHLIGKALIENKDIKLDYSEIDDLITEKDGIIYPNFIETTFKDIYYTDEENHWLDVVSTNIRMMKNPYKQAIAYFSLFQSCIIKRPYNLFHRRNLYVRMDNVIRSFGNKKTWDTPFDVHFRKFIIEANNAIFDNGENCQSINKDVFDIEHQYDFVYIDTPYLNCSGVGIDYADFYHFLNGITDYDNWHTRIDYKSNHLRLIRQNNEWNNKTTILMSFERLFTKFQNSIMAISYRSDGLPEIKDLVKILETLGKSVKVYCSNEIKYVLSKRVSNEILIIAK